MIDSGKHHLNGLMLALLGSLFLFAFPSNAIGNEIKQKFYVGDFVWFDTNCNGIQDPGEKGVPHVQVLAFDWNNIHQPIGETTVTDENGWYRLCLGEYYREPGEFYLQFILPHHIKCRFTRRDAGDDYKKNSYADSEGYTPRISWHDSYGYELLCLDAGVCCPDMPKCKGRIGNYVWFDKDCDGIQDHREVGINGVTVILEDADGNFVNSQITHTVDGQAGFYLFEGLCAGTYIVRVDGAVEGFFETEAGADDSTIFNDSDEHGGSFIILPDDHSTDPTIDFGYCQDCQECSGGVTELTLRYLGTSSPALIEVFDKKSENLLFQGVASPGSDFTFGGLPLDGKMGTEISVWVDGTLNTKIHTSCSRPIGPGLVSGDFEVVGGVSLNGGPLCPGDPPNGDCGPCKGKVTQLTLMYIGDANASITVVQKKDGKTVFTGNIAPGQSFAFNGQDKDGTLGTEITVFVGGSLNTKIHTSCSQPIGPGLVFGDFVVVSGSSSKGGPLCIGGDDDKKGGKKPPKKGGKKGRKKK